MTLTLSDVPVDECTLGIHEIEFMIKTGPCLGNGCGVGKHTDGTWDLGEVSSRYYCGGLVVDSDFESGRTPVDKLDRALCLDAGNSGVDVLGDNISSEIKDLVMFEKQQLPIEQTDSHVLSIARITLDHLIARLEAHVGDVSYGEGLVVGLFG